MRKPINKMWALALLAAAGACSSEEPSSQVITGRVGTTGVIAVRAVRAGEVITATQVRSDGSFTIALPANAERYRLEVLTTSGVRHLYSARAESSNSEGVATLASLSFRVCAPTDPYDLGGIGVGGTEPGGGGSGEPGGSEPGSPGCEDPTDPMCGGGSPGCEDPTDPMCGGGTPPCEDPMAPNCGVPPTPICEDPMDPYCFCDAMGDCPPVTCEAPAPGMGDVMCPPPPPPPCGTPTNPEVCPPDPCMFDPMACGCPVGAEECWPMPQPPSCDAMGEMCEPGSPGGGMVPEHPPTDFGCEDPDSPVSSDETPTMPPPGGSE